MLFKVKHTTEYQYDGPTQFGLQRLHQTAQSRVGQNVLNWSVSLEGARNEVSYKDHFGNMTDLVSLVPGADKIVIVAEGKVDTQNVTGVIGRHRGYVPLSLFKRQTERTHPEQNILDLAERVAGEDDLSKMHDLMRLLAEEVDYVPGATHAETTASEALAAKSGVCQDHAHIFVSAARAMGYPARYVSGLLHMENVQIQSASHAWAEVHIENFGWVGFDVSNKICPDERYICVATGLDYSDVAPILGIRHGWGNESLQVTVTVEQ